MRLFVCDNCSSPLYFENRSCQNCDSRVGFVPEVLSLRTLRPSETQGWWEAAAESGRLYRFCANESHDACNWLVPVDSNELFCTACRHNRTIPDITVQENLHAWRLFEIAKHRLVFTLLKLRLPLPNRLDEPQHGLAFDFLSETSAAAPVLTGHEDGLIVLNLKEADDAERARLRRELGEPYRTLLGHFRHESGHFYWDLLVKGARLDEFRELFGDERADYQEALRQYYANGPAADWQSRFVSAYATAHPWENFAETWAHYLHIADTTEMACSFGLRFRVRAPGVPLEFRPDDCATFEGLMAEWSSLTIVMNSLNRCMGESDLYPFVLPPPALSRLKFVHDLVIGATAQQGRIIPAAA